MVRRRGEYGDGGRDCRRRSRQRADMRRPHMPPLRSGRIEWPGESVVPEPVRSSRSGPVCQRRGRLPGSGPQNLIPEAWEESSGVGQRQRDDGRHSEEHRRGHFPAPSLGADHTPLHVLVDTLAQQDGQPVVPVFEQRVQDRAVPASGAGHDKHSERGLQLSAGTREERVPVVAGGPKYARDLTTGQAVTEL